jgi:cytidine deaminase
MMPEDLIKNAVKAQKNAQSKYSNFPVGSALLSSDNTITLGCNIESAVYPNTLCAERVAIYSAISKGITKFKAISIVSRNAAKPCGSCRQIIYEYLGNIPIYISDGKKDIYETHYIKDLLPFPFDEF